jgi:NAD+ kinase
MMLTTVQLVMSAEAECCPLLSVSPGGFPITLRHRLHCTIVRSANSPAAAASESSGSGNVLPCVGSFCVGSNVMGEEHVALNEVVIERGMSPFLTNLECFCDGTFVTHVQVSQH